MHVYKLSTKRSAEQRQQAKMQECCTKYIELIFTQQFATNFVCTILCKKTKNKKINKYLYIPQIYMQNILMQI